MALIKVVVTFNWDPPIVVVDIQLLEGGPWHVLVMERLQDEAPPHQVIV